MPAGAGAPASREGQRDDGHARVLDAGQLARRRRRRARPAGGPPCRPARPAPPRRRRPLRRPAPGRRPAAKPSGGAARSAHRRRAGPRPPAARGQRLGQPAQAAGQAGEHRAGRPAARRRQPRPGRGQQRAALGRQPARQRRHRRLQRQLVGPAGVDAAEQRLDQPVDHLVAEPLADQRADRRRPSASGGTASGRLGRDPASAGRGQHPAGRSAARSPGTPSTVPAGSGRLPPRLRTQRRGGQRVRPARRPRPSVLDQPARPPAGGPASPRRRRRTSAPASSTRRSLPPTGRRPPARRSRRPAGARRHPDGGGQAGDPAADDDHGAQPRASAATAIVHQLDDPGQHVRVGVRQHAVAEVEDVPGRRAALGHDPAHRALDHRPVGQQHAPGRGCPARRSGRRSGAAASSSGIRQSTPTTSAPALAASASEQLAGADAEVDPRHVREPASAANTALRVRQHELGVVGRGQRAGPRVEQLHRRRPGLDLGPQERRRRSRPAGRAGRARASGSAYMNALVRACSLDGPPSIR